MLKTKPNVILHSWYDLDVWYNTHIIDKHANHGYHIQTYLSFVKVFFNRMTGER